MPMSKAPIIAVVIISASLLLDAVWAQEPPQPQAQAQAQSQPLPYSQPAPTNGTAAKRKQSRRSMAREFILAHNVVRAHYREPPFKWDRGLARYARRFALKRVADCLMIHSFGPYGENIFWGMRDHWTPTDVVESWAKEHKYYNKDTNQCTQGQMCGHFTQIVWRDSVRLGCARVNCLNGGMYAICSYDPPGNYIDESPFDSKGDSDWVDEPEPDFSTTPPPSTDPPPSLPPPPTAQPSQT
ncbi:hypothetical protein PVL29_010193 [Vitis rotundifolia]|uniref:SCP domain-containing protein n=1 Tax=Vitis rotundifolia TaxID=103349 RepID=A0AA39DUH1_VITRO|nr:hypothetical protein PVL29_010193 [Vitis rotundifolia]